MGAREYIGTGGMRIRLDDPLSPEMARQVARGHLVPASGNAPDVEAGDKSLVIVHGSEATTADRFGVHRPAVATRPGPDATAKDWATHAVSLGLLATHASTLTLQQLQEWVEAHERALGEQEPAPVPAVDADSPDAVVPHETSGPAEVDRPAKNAAVAEWRAYVITLGMNPDDAKTATKTDCQDYADTVEQANALPEHMTGDPVGEGE